MAQHLEEKKGGEIVQEGRREGGREGRRKEGEVERR